MVKYILLVGMLYVIHGVSVADELPANSNVSTNNKSLDTSSVKLPVDRKVRSKPAITPSNVKMAIKIPLFDNPSDYEPVMPKK